MISSVAHQDRQATAAGDIDHYVVRLAGGLLYLSGMLIMAWNVVMTVRSGKVAYAPIPAVAAAHA